MSNCCNGSCWIIGSEANRDWELSWITCHFGHTVEVIFLKNVNQSLHFQIVCSDHFVRLVAAWTRTCDAEHLCHCLCVDGYSVHYNFLIHSDWGSEAASKYWAAAISIWLPRQRHSRIMELQSYKYEVHLKLLWMNLAIYGGRNVVAEGNFSWVVGGCGGGITHFGRAMFCLCNSSSKKLLCAI